MENNEFQKFLPGTIFKIKKRDKCRWRVPVSYQSDNWFGNCWGDQNLPQTHTHTDTHTQTHTHTPATYLISLFLFKKETRLKNTFPIKYQMKGNLNSFKIKSG